MSKRQVIVEVNGSQPLAAEAEAAATAPLSIVPAPPEPTGGVLVPTSGQMDVMLAESNDFDSLVDLEKAADALKEVAKRQDSMKAQLMEIAAWHLRVRRKLGLLLRQTVRWGGDRSRSSMATLLDGALPDGVDKHASRRCRRLADIPDDLFDGYLAKCLERGRPPSFGGALRVAPADEPRKAAKPRRHKGGDVSETIPPVILDIVARVFGEVDVLVGDGDVKCAKKCKADTLRPNDLRGCVIVTDCPDPATWLPKLAALRKSAAIEQVAVVLAPETSAAWFIQAALDEWVFGFVPGDRCMPMIALQGRREGLFAAVGLARGVVVRS